jgi:hypothetical protein
MRSITPWPVLFGHVPEQTLSQFTSTGWELASLDMQRQSRVVRSGNTRFYRISQFRYLVRV